MEIKIRGKMKITKPPWRINNYRPSNGKIVQAKSKSSDNDARPGNRLICTCNDNGKKPANAIAIVTAVNNTYSKGIDPEAVPDMVEALENALNNMNEYGQIFPSNYEEMKAALKKTEL